MPESAFGPVNNSIGIGYKLQQMGHRCVFVVESSWKEKLTKYGFIEIFVDLSFSNTCCTETQQSDEFWSEFIFNQLSEFRKSPVEQLRTIMHSTWNALIDDVKFSNEQLKRIVKEVKPDVIAEDNAVTFPALITNNHIRFVRIVSCTPLEIRCQENIVPSPYSGLPSNDQSQWTNFEKEYKIIHNDIWKEFNNWLSKRRIAISVVITDGGYNTVCESLHFGKPMIILPLFWDQHDNAQRLHETDCGIRLDTYAFTDQQMYESIEYLLNDQKVRQRLISIGETIRARNGLQLAAEKIEQHARQARSHSLNKQRKQTSSP